MDYFDRILQYEEVERMLRRERVIRDRSNPFNAYDDADFISRYRFSKDTVLEIVQMLGNRLERKNHASYSVPPLIQIVVALRFYGTGAFLKTIGDTFGLHECSVSRIVKDVSMALAEQCQRYIKFPAGAEIRQAKRTFMELGQIPGVIGAIDCTHIPIQSPGGENAELFRNRKGYFSLNVQAVCDSDHKFTNIVARWPGSTHDSRIFENSRLAARFDNNEINGILLGDNGYPLKPYLMTPVLQPTTPAQRRFNTHLSRARVRIENLFGTWKRRFPCLRQQLRLKLQTSLTVIVACAVLQNIARMRRDPLPDDGIDLQLDDVPVPAIHINAGGQARRNILIRRF